MSATTKVLEALQSGREISPAQIASQFKVANPRVVINSLRSKGYSIYLNAHTDTVGRVNRKYRLGTPTKAVVAAGNAAMTAARGA